MGLVWLGGGQAPEDDGVPLHDVVVLRRPVDALRRVVLHPLEIAHEPSPCRRRHGWRAREPVRRPRVRGQRVRFP